MSRIEQLAEGVTLYLGDCREILPSLGRVDAVVTDPPYGIGFVHSGSIGRKLQGGRPEKKAPAPIRGDDQEFNPSALLGFDCVLLGADHYHWHLPKTGTFHVWDKHCGRGGNDSFSDAELIWTNRRTKTRVFRHLWKGLLRDQESASGPRLHPSQKPISLMSWCITELGQPASSVVDPYLGSGTTGIAAVKHGRKFTGIEIEPKYFDIACKRIQAALDAPDMFIEPPVKAKQEAFEL